ncbi:uncharacterized protein KY384_006170 [Bacidia gigantensis]|uniref:uncharacterized protein n=1 Tax=Bacidia gigantensis TaxID=2732470 RepID=UPI001D039122|nr:uncharacterized protein KY384_006170 [Bacidia gigantensis]KAG8529533.1 hypothetical protein KY384_006170 [Bacidia gigantensis]
MYPENEDLREGLTQLLESGESTDLIVRTALRHIPVHKLIVCAQSPVLKAICTSGFKETSSNIIDLTDDKSESIERLVHFFYDGHYYVTEEGPGTVGEVELNLSEHIEMYALADKYDIDGLKKAAIQGYKMTLDLATGRETIRQNIRKALLTTLAKVFESTPDSSRGLRDAAIMHIISFADDVVSDQKLKTLLYERCQEIPHLSWAIMCGKAGNFCLSCKNTGQTKCPECEQHEKVQKARRHEAEWHEGGLHGGWGE